MSKESCVYQEANFKLQRLIELNPKMKQREFTTLEGVILGITNYCMNALLEKGLIKLQNFKSNKRKLAYAYLLTPPGIPEKELLTQWFLKRKVKEYEYEVLKTDIELLKLETSDIFSGCEHVAAIDP